MPVGVVGGATMPHRQMEMQAAGVAEVVDRAVEVDTVLRQLAELLLLRLRWSQLRRASLRLRLYLAANLLLSRMFLL